MASKNYEFEYAHTDEALSSVLQALSGSNRPICLDQEPTRKYSIGILNPEKVDEGHGVTTSSKRRPSTLGFESSLRYSGSIDMRISLSFAVYWRAIPTYAEQKENIEESMLENLSASTGETQLRLKYCREEIDLGPIDITINSPTETFELGVDTEAVNAAIQEKLVSVSKAITEREESWPADVKDTPIPFASLASEETYNAYIKSQLLNKPSETPAWAAKFSLKLWPMSADRVRMAAMLTNVSVEREGIKHPQAFLTTQFSIELLNGDYQSVPYAAAALDYRYSSESWGRGVNCVLKVSDSGKRAQTETTPIYYQQRMMTRLEMNEACSFERLGSSDMFAALNEIDNWLEAYAKKWRDENDTYESDSSYRNRSSDLAEFELELDRYRLGVDALRKDERLAKAFQMANQSFGQGQHPGWRLFQLVFVVTQATSLLARESRTDELLEALHRVDVLWFPTGGGKTEAYFGVIATALFYDRLRGKTRGVTAWLRYPLRMLSIQQLQRLMEIVVYADKVRLAQNSPELVNGEPFTLGYYVGQKNTPNDLTYPFDKPANKQLLDLKRQNEEVINSEENPLLVLQRCPYPDCKSSDIGTDIAVKDIRVRHVCETCHRESPIFITDTEIYRYAPSIIVGTVDRLARAGQTHKFAHLFGKSNKLCPDHGLVSFDKCLEMGPGACERKPSEYVELPEPYDPTPSLLLQDELHLLRESLGTYDSHYETFLDVLSASVGSGLPPKRLAATATIEGYQAHIKELYARKAGRFPVKGMRENESAYVMESLKDPTSRIYVGILPTGSETKEVVGDILKALQDYTEEKFDSPKLNSAEQAVTSVGLVDNYDLSLAYVNEKNTAGDLRSNWSDDQNVQVLTGDRGLHEVRAAIARIESDQDREFRDRLKFLIATSVISHGVDLERLNYMAFAGMPGSASDYIQASSRVGRTHLGVVFTVFKSENNRERNIYQRFYEYHERLYQLVQPIPVNRISQSALSRTVTGILGACILNILSYGVGKEYGGFFKASQFMKALDDGKVTDEQLIEMAVESLGIKRAGLPGDSERIVINHITGLIRDARRMIQTEEESTTHNRMKPQPVSSLREVSTQLGFELDYQSAKIASQLMQGRIGRAYDTTKK